MKRARLKDVAEVAGCSIAVVSHVVNNASGNITCGEYLRQKVLRAAAELGYTPHYASRALKMQRSFTIGIYIPATYNRNGSLNRETAILDGVERACRELSYDLLLISLGDGTPASECANKLNERRVDGLIVLHADGDSEWVGQLADSDKNVVAINYFGAAQIDRINFNNKAASAMAVAELAKLNHRKIGYIGPLGDIAPEDASIRLHGFLEGCAATGIAVNPAMVFDTGAAGTPDVTRTASGEHETAETIASIITATHPDDRPTALVGHSDASLLLVLRELMRNELRVPKDISAIGMDDSFLCRFFLPELASVKQPFFEMGEKAARHVIEESEMRPSNDLRPQTKRERWEQIIDPEFIERASIARREV